jgi:hypothetical protein
VAFSGRSVEARGKCPVRVQQGGPRREVDILRRSEYSTEYYQNFTTAITFSRAAGGNARSNEVHASLSDCVACRSGSALLPLVGSRPRVSSRRSRLASCPSRRSRRLVISGSRSSLPCSCGLPRAGSADIIRARFCGIMPGQIRRNVLRGLRRPYC